MRRVVLDLMVAAQVNCDRFLEDWRRDYGEPIALRVDAIESVAPEVWYFKRRPDDENFDLCEYQSVRLTSIRTRSGKVYIVAKGPSLEEIVAAMRECGA